MPPSLAVSLYRNAFRLCALHDRFPVLKSFLSRAPSTVYASASATWLEIPLELTLALKQRHSVQLEPDSPLELVKIVSSMLQTGDRYRPTVCFRDELRKYAKATSSSKKKSLNSASDFEIILAAIRFLNENVTIACREFKIPPAIASRTMALKEALESLEYPSHVLKMREQFKDLLRSGLVPSRSVLDPNANLLIQHPIDALKSFAKSDPPALTFENAVVLVFKQHDEDFGLVLNRPTRIQYGSLMDPGDLAGPDMEAVMEMFGQHHLYWGGPVTSNAGCLVLHPFGELKNAIKVMDGLYLHCRLSDAVALLNSGREVCVRVPSQGDGPPLTVKRKARPSDFKFFFGFASWGQGQLAGECKNGDWFRAEACSPSELAEFALALVPAKRKKNGPFSSSEATTGSRFSTPFSSHVISDILPTSLPAHSSTLPSSSGPSSSTSLSTSSSSATAPSLTPSHPAPLPSSDSSFPSLSSSTSTSAEDSSTSLFPSFKPDSSLIKSRSTVPATSKGAIGEQADDDNSSSSSEEGERRERTRPLFGRPESSFRKAMWDLCLLRLGGEYADMAMRLKSS